MLPSGDAGRAVGFCHAPPHTESIPNINGHLSAAIRHIFAFLDFRIRALDSRRQQATILIADPSKPKDSRRRYTFTSMLTKTKGFPPSTYAAAAPPQSTNVRWFVCGLLFLATTINYMDRSVLSLIEPVLHTLPFMGWDPAQDAAHQSVFNNNYGNIVICFQIAYGIGLLTAGRLIDKLGTKLGYALAIGVWALSSMGHALVFSVGGFCIARFMLGLGEAGNFPAAIKATTEWFPSEERALATGLFNSGTNASAFIAPPLIAYITLRYSWHAAFLTTGSMGLIWLGLWLIFPYNRLRRGATMTQANLAWSPLRGRAWRAAAQPRPLRVCLGEDLHRSHLVVLSLLFA